MNTETPTTAKPVNPTVTHSTVAADTYKLHVGKTEIGNAARVTETEKAKKEGKERKVTVFKFVPLPEFEDIGIAKASTMKALKETVADMLPDGFVAKLAAAEKAKLPVEKPAEPVAEPGAAVNEPAGDVELE